MSVFYETSPNSMMRALSVKVIPKRSYDEVLLKEELRLMPVVKDDWNVVGCGDWGRGRSGGGSVVLGNGENVIKMHLGEIMGRRPLIWAAQKDKISKMFADVSPPTLVMVVDGSDGPKPAIVQKQIIGNPIYKASLKEIWAPEVTGDLAKIVKLMRLALKEDIFPDISGLRLKSGHRIIDKLLVLCPIFSDNIMVDRNNRIWLVDNVPEIRQKNIKDVSFLFKRGVVGVILLFWEVALRGLNFSQKFFRGVGKRNNWQAWDRQIT